MVSIGGTLMGLKSAMEPKEAGAPRPYLPILHLGGPPAISCRFTNRSLQTMERP